MTRVARNVIHDVQSYINRYSRYHQSILTIEQFTHFGKTASPKESYAFLKHEVPTRLAHIMQEINHLPKNLLEMPSVELVKSWYVQSFVDLVEYLNGNDADQHFDEEVIDRFTETLHTIKNRHDKTVETMAQGVIELKHTRGENAIVPKVQYFLDRFYMNRIGIRLLITQHLALFEREKSKKFIGVFEPNCDIKKVVIDAVQNASDICDRTYFDSPNVRITEHNTISPNNDIIAAYVPTHLYFMLFELIKNAMRATVELHEDKDELPRIEIDIVKGKEDLTIKICDCGGGIRRGEIENLFTYHYSTAPEPDTKLGIAPLAGYGYGLPLSRLYAKYFGGDIQISSMEGLGTSAYLYLKALSEDAHEVIPLYNKKVAKNYENEQHNQQPQKDWSCDSFYTGHVQSYSKPHTRNLEKSKYHSKGSDNE